jgi:hypothetical protein
VFPHLEALYKRNQLSKMPEIEPKKEKVRGDRIKVKSRFSGRYPGLSLLFPDLQNLLSDPKPPREGGFNGGDFGGGRPTEISSDTPGDPDVSGGPIAKKETSEERWDGWRR